MSNNIPITNGAGNSSVAAEEISSQKYQQIKVVGGEVGSTSVMGVNPDRSINVSVVGTVNVTGSVVAAGNQSVSGTVGASIIGIVPVQLSNSSVIAIIQGSVATVGTAVANQSVSGTVGASIIGIVPVQLSNSSVLTVIQSSVITVWQNSSVLSVPVGSTIAVLQAPSIVGTYAEDAPSASGDKGFLVMGARNDTLASVTSNDGDYSSHVVGPAGELIAENAPLTKWVSGTNSMLGGVPLTSSVTVIAAQGTSVFTYITGAQVANMGSASVLVGFYGGTSSLLAYTIAPAGGGSNLYFQNGIKTAANSAFAASVSGTSSIFVSAQGFISKT